MKKVNLERQKSIFYGFIVVNVIGFLFFLIYFNKGGSDRELLQDEESSQYFPDFTELDLKEEITLGLQNDVYSQASIEFKNNLSRQVKKFPHSFFVQGNTTKKRIALTFDDAPDTVHTEKVLAILNKYNVKATFFLVGFKMERHPKIVEQIYEQGHDVGNHSYSHPNFTEYSTNSIMREQILKTEKLFQEILGVRPKMIRPPYGQIRDGQIRHLEKKGYKIIDWSVDSFDWHPQKNASETIVERVLDYAHSGAIILLHAGGLNKENTVEALPALIVTLKNNGYEFVTVEELLQLRPYFLR